VRTHFLLGSIKERDHAEDLNVEGKIILKWVYWKQVGGRGLDYSGSRQGPVAGSCERGNEPLVP
jgi:hypothetical protein